jgi:hypothetical protein
LWSGRFLEWTVWNGPFRKQEKVDLRILLYLLRFSEAYKLQRGVIHTFNKNTNLGVSIRVHGISFSRRKRYQSISKAIYPSLGYRSTQKQLSSSLLITRIIKSFSPEKGKTSQHPLPKNSPNKHHNQRTPTAPQQPLPSTLRCVFSPALINNSNIHRVPLDLLHVFPSRLAEGF